MHIPPYYKRASWQRFFAGTFVGAITAFLVFIYMYGQMYENWVEENLDLRAQLQEMSANYQALEQSNKELDQQFQQKATIASITINISNQEQLNLDHLIARELEESIKKEWHDVIGKDVASLSENYTFLIRTVENKTYKIDDFSYEAQVDHLFVTETLEAYVTLTLAN